jgi:hypothetical protein
MARQQYNDGQEVVFEDYNRMQARREQEVYDRVIYEMVDRQEDAFFGDGLKANFSTPTSVVITPGIGFQTDATVDSWEPQKRLLYRGSGPVLNLSSPDGALDRIDVVSVKHARADGATESRKFKDAGTLVISNQNLVTTNEWEADFTITPGTPAASPVAPATPAGEVKVAELYVTAVTGMAGSGAVTDSRNLMPINASALVNTLGFERLTASSGESVQSLMAELDALMKDSKWNTNILADSVSDAAAPANAGEKVLYLKGDLLFMRDSVPDGSAITPVGSGGGGGGGLIWQEPSGSAPLKVEENEQEVYLYEQSQSQELVVYIKVPESYIAGRQIKANLASYSPSSADDWKMQLVSTLIRQNLDAISSTVNQETNDSGDQVNSVANQYRNLLINVTDGVGAINGVSVSAGDLLKLELTREAPAGTEDTADIRFVATSTEVRFT